MLRSIAARHGADRYAAEARCDASRSMRAHPLARPHPSRRAYARSVMWDLFGIRAPRDEDRKLALRLTAQNNTSSFPRRVFAPGLWFFRFATRVSVLPSTHRRTVTVLR